MKCDHRTHRRSLRLKEYDYSQAGAYFITLCTQNGASLFGNVVGGEMHHSEAGKMVVSVWNEIRIFYPGLDIDAFVVMPNHLHGILILAVATATGEKKQGAKDCGDLSLGAVVGRFKTLTMKRYVDGVQQSGWPRFHGRLWQRNYYEHVIRDEASLDHIRQYIVENPSRWSFDRENPESVSPESEDAWCG